MSAPRGVAVILVSLLVSAASLSITVRPGYAVAPVPWPASTGLLLAEVQTGGASASDEFVEVYNAGAVEIDLGGCELIYTSATGATTSRKAAFASPLLLVPGAHLLVANSAGIYGSSADATYTGGLASDGGSLALRYVAGAVIDAVGWGTATNSYVEGLVAPAPPARSSLERRPGGIDGNWADSNDNTSDWAVQPNPVPQSLISSPVPAPTSSPAPTSTATRTSEPTATPSPEPTVSPFPTDSAAPTVSPPPTLEPTPSKCPSPTATPSATPTISPSPKVSASPRVTISPTAVPVYHNLATGLAVRGRTVDVDATVTATVGIIDWGGPTIVVDDGTAAVAVVIPDGAASPRVGEAIRIVGKSGSLHSGRRVVASVVELRGDGVALKPRRISTTLGAGDEWQFVSVYGRIQRLTHAGSRWRADLAVGGQTVAVLGEPGARVSSALMIVGRPALVTGIVRRSTSDSSVFQLLPRSAADLTLGPVPAVPGGTPSPAATVRTSGPGASGPVAIATAGRLVTVAEIPDNEGATVTVAGVIVETGPGTAILDDGTGRILLGGSAASDAISLLEPGDAVEVTGRVSRDADGWLIEVDPDLILSLAGVPAAAASSDARSEIASPGVEGTASSAPALAGELPAAGGQAHGLARPAEGMAGSNPIEIPAFAVGALALLILIGLAVALVARRRGTLPRPRRFARRGRGARDADGATSR